MTVFCVLAHGDPTTFNHLAHRMTPATMVVHVDAKSSLDGYVESPAIHYVGDRVRVSWAGFSQVEATMRVYEAALKLVRDESEHIVLLSGQCIPLRPLVDLEDFLAKSPWNQHCKAGLLLDGRQRNEDRVRKTWRFDQFDARARPPMRQFNAAARRLITMSRGSIPLDAFDGLTVAAGSNWTALTAACVDDILARSDLVERCTSLFRNALGPDEIFFHTLVHSTKWGQDTATPDPAPKGDRRTADFANLHYIYRSLTKFIAVEDLPQLRESSAYFSRKADLRANPELAGAFSCLDVPGDSSAEFE